MNFSKENAQYISKLKEDSNIEIDILKNRLDIDRPYDKYYIKLIEKSFFRLSRILKDFSQETNHEVDLKRITPSVLNVLKALSNGAILSPLIGDESEWEEIDNTNHEGEISKYIFNGKEYEIQVNSVQRNRRMNTVYRFNNDNRFAHRIDHIVLHNVKNPNETILTDESIRFIQFPYNGEVIHEYAVVDDENNITGLVNYESMEELRDTVDFKGIKAPIIPLHMMIEE